MNRIKNIILGTAGADNIEPRICYIDTQNTIAEVTATGFLNQAVAMGNQFKETDMCLVVTKTSPSATSQQVGWYEITKSGANTSLTSTGAPGSITLPTIANHIAVFNNTTGGIGEDAATAINGGNIQAGLSGTAGTLYSFPATATTGKFGLVGVANAGDFTVAVSNASHGQATTYSIADIGAATGGLLSTTTALRSKIVAGAAAAGGAAAQSFTDAFCTSASCVIGNWNTQTNAASVLKIVPGNGSFVVTSSADAGVGTFNYVITKA